MKSAIIEAAEYIERQAEEIRELSTYKICDGDKPQWTDDDSYMSHQRLQRLAQRLRAEAQRPAIPEGWKLVPTDMTDDMDAAADQVFWQERTTWRDMYTAMLNAAPTPPAVKESLTTDPRWEDAPEWANWLAMDEDGWWGWYAMRPEVSDEGPWWKRGNGDNITELCNMSPPTPSKAIWTKSLQQRPSNPASDEVES